MARKLRVQYPGAIYHVMNRGDHSETIYRDTSDRDLFPATLAEACGRPAWLRTERLLGEWGIPMDTPAGREQFARALEARRQSEQAENVTELPPSDWCVGSEEFRQELLQQMTALPAHKYGGREWQETAEKKARRILAEELRRRGWEVEELKRRRKGDRDKIQIARRLRAETTMTLAWIAQNLSMGAPGSLANCLRNKEQ